MNVYTKNKPLIGKGLFSKVYGDLNSPTVTIVTVDNAKECLALFCKKMKHLPDTKRIDDGVYIQPRYNRISSVADIKEWKALKKIHNEYNSFTYSLDYAKSIRNYNTLIDLIEKYKDDLGNDLYEALLELISAYSNYEYNIGFEIARRNLALDNEGNLILLDVIFSPELLNKKRGKKTK